MRNFPKVSPIWVQLINPRLINSFFGASFNEWIELNFREKMNGSNRRDWLDVFVTTCWKILNWRNKEIHKQSYSRSPQCHNEILKKVKEISEAFERRRK
ncbi:hypothetical protein AHAS_Ahas15G0094000 [Arachis hypogaea]